MINQPKIRRTDAACSRVPATIGVPPLWTTDERKPKRRLGPGPSERDCTHTSKAYTDKHRWAHTLAHEPVPRQCFGAESARTASWTLMMILRPDAWQTELLLLEPVLESPRGVGIITSTSLQTGHNRQCTGIRSTGTKLHPLDPVVTWYAFCLLSQEYHYH